MCVMSSSPRSPNIKVDKVKGFRGDFVEFVHIGGDDFTKIPQCN